MLPIPPGKHWADEMPVLLPGTDVQSGTGLQPVKTARALAHGLKTRATKDAGGTPAPRGGRKVAAVVQTTASRRLSFAPVVAVAVVEPPKPEPKVKEKKPKRKNDPKLVAAARELRDRWLERVNAGEYVFEDSGKYDVSRALPDSPAPMLPGTPAPMLSLPPAA